MNKREVVQNIFLSALKTIISPAIPGEYIKLVHSLSSEKTLEKLVVIGFGKASCHMAAALRDALPRDAINSGMLITKYGHTLDMEQNSHIFNADDMYHKRITVFEAGHPLPDENGLRATEKIIKLVKSLDENTLVICLISGGGSSLLVYPYRNITLQDKQEVTDLLLKAGANINELNTVRKHLSMVKGGRLAELIFPANVVSFIISDVIGDRIDIIASGPTAPDESTFQDALNVVKKYNLENKIPATVMNILKEGRDGLVAETPQSGSNIFKNVTNIIVANNHRMLNAVEENTRLSGYQTEITAYDISGEARDVGKHLARNALKAMRDGKKICLISGGETTVTVKGEGKGGRNTELALSFAREIQGCDGITFLSAGSDGTDGPTDAAGAVVDGQTIKRAKSLGLDPKVYLENNDSYNFFKKIDSLLITGPTGTNVMDVQMILIG
jgi:hydroxypyruvate reductase/glycerate 2-kinase